MNDKWRHVVSALTRRAGLTGVPASALAAGLVGSAAIAVAALIYWWPSTAGGAHVVYEGPASAGRAGRDGGRLVAEESVLESQGAATDAAALVVVHVVGAVRHPGVYRLAAGARVDEAVGAAGGTLPDAVLESVNLARVLADGEQIVVPDEDNPGTPVPGSPAPSSAGAVVGGGQAPAPVNINTADAAALDALPGVGPSTAAKIVADRQANGPFTSVEDLGRVSGIGPKKLEQLKGLACVR